MKILVTRSSMPPVEEYINEIKDIWDSHWLTNMGPKHKQFQESLRSYLGVNNIELFTNGHMALELSLQALGLGDVTHNSGKEVITTPFTFASTTHAIVRNGLKPVFCDIKESDYTIDEDKLEALINNNTVAIMPVHVYGNICNIEKIDAIAKKHNLKVIYDAAHTFGETYKGQGIGSFGDASCFSFHATKVFNTIEGGATCFKDPEVGKKLYDLKNFGIHDAETVAAVGSNAKMNEFCAAMGICNLRHIEEEITKRKKVDELYRERLSNISGIKLSLMDANIKYNHAYFPIVVDKNVFGISRDDIYNILLKNGVVARKYFYPLVNDFECYKDVYDSSDTPTAKYISDNVLTLPMYSDLDLCIVNNICDLILNCK